MNALMFQFFMSLPIFFVRRNYENKNYDGKKIENAFGDKNKIGSRGTHFHNGMMIRRKRNDFFYSAAKIIFPFFSSILI